MKDHDVFADLVCLVQERLGTPFVDWVADVQKLCQDNGVPTRRLACLVVLAATHADTFRVVEGMTK
jgi:hypothetical protein